MVYQRESLRLSPAQVMASVGFVVMRRYSLRVSRDLFPWLPLGTTIRLPIRREGKSAFWTSL